MAIVSVRELNANISKMLARVEAGETVDVAKNGRIVAEIRPKRPARDAKWQDAYERTLARMAKGLPLGIGKITEEDRYGDDRL